MTGRIERSDQLYRALIEMSDDSMLILDSAVGRILDGNERALSELGLDRADLAEGTELSPEPGGPEDWKALVERIRAGQEVHHRCRWRRRGVSLRGLDFRFRGLEVGSESYVIAIASRRSGDEEREITLELERLNRDLGALNAIGVAVSRSLELEEVLEAALRQTVASLGLDGGTICLCDPQGAHHRSLLRVDGSSSPEIERDLGCDERSFCHEVLSRGKVLVSSDRNDEAWRSIAGTAISSGGVTLGALTLGSHRPGRFEPRDSTLLAGIGSLIGMAVQNAQLFEKSQSENADRQLSLMNLEEEHRRLYQVLDLLPFYVFLHAPEHAIPFANKQFLELFGDPSGLRCYDVLQGRCRPGVFCAALEVLSSDSSYTGEWTDDHGRTYMFHDIAFPSRDGGSIALEVGFDITDRKIAEERLRALGRELALSEDRQRREIAEGLHDGVGQLLYALRMRAERLQGRIESEEGAILAEIIALASQASSDMRRLVFEICPPALYEGGLEAALAWLVLEAEERHELSCSLSTPPGKIPMSGEIASLLYRACREILLNVVKHAKARRAEVKMRTGEDDLVLEVRDDGAGFEGERDSRASSRQGGFGLFNIQERLAHIGGELEIESEPGRGTSVRLLIPLACLGPESIS